MTQKVFTTPTNDVVFKAIFAKEGDKEPLKSLLSSIMNLPVEAFDDLVLLNTELVPDRLGDKTIRLDILIKLKDKTEIDVEVQVFGHNGYKERVLYYWSKLYSASLVEGQNYTNLKKCVMINIVYFDLSKSPKMHTKYQVQEINDHEIFTDHLEIHVLELSKLDAYNRNIESELLINWAEFLSLENEDELMSFKDRKDLPEAVQKAIEAYESIKDDPNLKMEALNRQIAILDYIQRWDDARAEGLAEGKAEGKAEGIEEGIILVAKKLKQQGIDYNSIAMATGLTLEFIEKL